MKRKLTRPVEWCGKTYEELDLDFEKLTGAHLIACAREADVLSPTPIRMRETSIDYLRAVAAKAAGVPVDLLDVLSAKDFTALTVETQAFLLAGA